MSVTYVTLYQRIYSHLTWENTSFYTINLCLFRQFKRHFIWENTVTTFYKNMTLPNDVVLTFLPVNATRFIRLINSYHKKAVEALKIWLLVSFTVAINHINQEENYYFLLDFHNNKCLYPYPDSRLHYLIQPFSYNDFHLFIIKENFQGQNCLRHRN